MDIREKDQKYIAHTYGRVPLTLSGGHGSYVTDDAGKEYIDLGSGIAVNTFGVADPGWVQAVTAQLSRLQHTSNYYYTEPMARLAELLCEKTGMSRVFFSNSGAEANEAAIKIARRYQQAVRGRDAWRVITLENCFHGRTMATLAATGKHTDGFTPLPDGFSRVPWGDIDALERAMTPDTAAVLVEMIQGEGGVFPLEPEYATALRDLCRERGVLFMADEVQAGMGRSGRFWAFQHYGVEPDVFTSAKSMANGLPLGAMQATDEVAQGFDYGSHATTFGGGALVTAVGLKVLEIMERDGLVARAAELGARACARFRELGERLPGTVREVRGKGLIIGVELALDDDICRKVWERLLEKGFVLNLTYGKTLRLLPPLNIEEADLEHFTEALEETLKELV